MVTGKSNSYSKVLPTAHAWETFGGGFHFLEYERTVNVVRARRKLIPYRRMAEIGRTLPVLFACESTLTENHLLAVDDLPLVTTTMEGVLVGPLTGASTVWRSPSGDPVALHCQLRR